MGTLRVQYNVSLNSFFTTDLLYTCIYKAVLPGTWPQVGPVTGVAAWAATSPVLHSPGTWPQVGPVTGVAAWAATHLFYSTSPVTVSFTITERASRSLNSICNTDLLYTLDSSSPGTWPQVGPVTGVAAWAATSPVLQYLTCHCRASRSLNKPICGGETETGPAQPPWRWPGLVVMFDSDVRLDRPQIANQGRGCRVGMGADHQIFETTLSPSLSLSRTHLPPSFIICLITRRGGRGGYPLRAPPKAISAASSQSAKTQLKFKMICSRRAALSPSAGRISMHLLHYVNSPALTCRAASGNKLVLIVEANLGD
ncbi:hypothetical protein J6590_029759 [Homalodisca vitripennis]|nr:hypothetical protein J6590_029759 [Homalodisca vitripennis]